jgi:hypothetical protein
MAETMTYDAGTDTITTSETLNADEQDSLQVGEALMNEQDNLILGKYKNAEELEKAHVELEKKLGELSGEDSDEEYEDTEAEYDDETTDDDDGEYEFSAGADLIADASTEFAETGEISLETMEQFADLSSQELVEAYVELQDAIGPQAEETAADLSDNEISSIQDSVGGEEAYQQLIGWANENVEQNYIEAFDSVVNTGSPEAIQLVVNGLQAQYEYANGYEGRMLSGKPPSGSGDVFRSQAEVVDAMSDPRYDNDPAYRQDLIQKLDRSDLAF